MVTNSIFFRSFEKMVVVGLSGGSVHVAINSLGPCMPVRIPSLVSKARVIEKQSMMTVDVVGPEAYIKQ